MLEAAALIEKRGEISLSGKPGQKDRFDNKRSYMHLLYQLCVCDLVLPWGQWHRRTFGAFGSEGGPRHGPPPSSQHHCTRDPTLTGHFAAFSQCNCLFVSVRFSQQCVSVEGTTGPRSKEVPVNRLDKCKITRNYAGDYAWVWVCLGGEYGYTGQVQ